MLSQITVKLGLGMMNRNWLNKLHLPFLFTAPAISLAIWVKNFCTNKQTSKLLAPFASVIKKRYGFNGEELVLDPLARKIALYLQSTREFWINLKGKLSFGAWNLYINIEIEFWIFLIPENCHRNNSQFLKSFIIRFKIFI